MLKKRCNTADASLHPDRGLITSARDRAIGQSSVAKLKRYIRNQKQHHRRVTFQDEYRKFLKRYQIDQIIETLEREGML